MLSRRSIALIAPLAVAASALALIPPIAQDPAYHEFADHRAFLGVPNAGDVLSNLAFLVVGTIGLLRARRVQYAVFFAGVLLTGVGSAYYHLAPDTPRLVWDRLPMTVAFMALVSAAVSERIDQRLGLRLLVPLLWTGAGSVLVWAVTEANGEGDLRPYAFVQFGGIVALALIGMLYRPQTRAPGYLTTVIATYAGAKLFEHLDAATLAATGIVSGHTLKHLVAALAPVAVLHALARRGELSKSMSPITFTTFERSPARSAVKYSPVATKPNSERRNEQISHTPRDSALHRLAAAHDAAYPGAGPGRSRRAGARASSGSRRER